MKRFLSLILLCLFITAVPPRPEGDTSDAFNRPILLAQNSAQQNNDAKKEEKKSDAELMPLPPAKYSITTEKPVKGIPGEIRKKEEPPAETPPPATVQAPDSTAVLKPQPATVQAPDSSAVKEPPPVALQKPDSTAVAQARPAIKQEGPEGKTPGVSALPVPSTPTPTAQAAAVPSPAIPTPSAAQPDSTVSRRDTTGVPPDIEEQIKKEQEKSGVPPDIQEQAAKDGAQARKLREELSIVNVPTANLRTMKYVIDDDYSLRGMVYGEEQVYIHILKSDDAGNFSEVWKSPPCNSPIRGLFVDDLDGNGEAEIVAFTADGNFYIYSYFSHDLLYKTPEGTYQNINCMIVTNMDSDPQKELFFIGVKPGMGGTTSGNPAGNFIQFDTKSQFEEWSSTDLYTATDMIIGNVDGDPEEEIVLNTGEILNKQFKDIEWRSTVELGSRLYLIDMDNDGILELVAEYGESYVKIIDVDQRREKW